MHARPALIVAAAALVLHLCTACASPVGVRAPGPLAAVPSGSASDGSLHAANDHEGDHGHDHVQGADPAPEASGRPLPHPVHDDLANGYEHDHAARSPLCTDLRRGWCEPPEHSHASACGTPRVHGFLTEPAFLGRDLFLDVSRADDETEVEVEVEWSLTRRLGLVAELPYVAADESGFGDAAIGLRALLVEERRFLLSASTEFGLPTGSESRGLGSGDLALGAIFHTWTDLGSWITLQTQAGIEYVPDERESEFGWSVTLAKSFGASPLVRTRESGHDDHGPTVFSLLAEIQGLTALSGDTGTTEGRWLLGASYPLARRLDIRGAFSHSFGGDEDEGAWTLGFILHL